MPGGPPPNDLPLASREPPTAAPRFEPHNRIAGKFRLRKRLATGGMGEVWVARNESTGADVALKVLRRGDTDREHELQVEERFRHEARLSAMLSHRSIVKVFDLVEESGGTLVLVMELLRGETLQHYVERKGPRPAREAVAVVTPILSALAHAHARGVVHRDVTPSNIFLAIDPDGHVTPKLVDFGIAKIAARPAGPALPMPPVQTLDGRVLGTPRYMAPERIRGAADIDGRTDVFAVAVVLYETMTGMSPFAASSPSASLAAVLERHIDPDPRIEPRLWVELQRALSKRPYERHATADEFAAALRAAVGETDGALEASLKRTQPPLGWDDEEADGGSDAAAREYGSGEGASLTIPRRRIPAAAWWLVGAGLGVGIGLALFGLHEGGASQGRETATAAASAPTARTAAAPAAAIGTAAGIAAAATAVPTATASPTPTPTPAVVTTAIPTAAAISPGPLPSNAASSPHPRAASPRVRPVATTPGF